MDAEELYHKLVDDVVGYLGVNELSDEADEVLADACRNIVDGRQPKPSHRSRRFVVTARVSMEEKFVIEAADVAAAEREFKNSGRLGEIITIEEE